MYLNIYFMIYNIFSPLNPTMLNIRSGKQKSTNRNIFIFKFIDNKVRINQTTTYHIILNIAVE